VSKLETPMTRQYWRSVGGTLVEEFPLVRGSKTAGPRYVDALILPNQALRIARPSEVNLEGEDVIVVQTKASRLGMYLMGQAVFSAELVLRFNPKSVRSVALCSADDSELHPLLAHYSNIEVVVLPPVEVAVAQEDAIDAPELRGDVPSGDRSPPSSPPSLAQSSGPA
jgi:hypothetical protein